MILARVEKVTSGQTPDYDSLDSSFYGPIDTKQDTKNERNDMQISSGSSATAVVFICLSVTDFVLR